MFLADTGFSAKRKVNLNLYNEQYVREKQLFSVVILSAIMLLLIVSFVPISHGYSPSVSSKDIVVINLQENVDPGSSAFFKSSLTGLSSSSVEAVVINMNTPGGYISDMLQIISYINSTEHKGIPVYTYIDAGGLASSAGSYIALSSDFVFMGPSSTIGPSSPVVLGGSSSETVLMEELMQSLAVAHGKNTSAALSMITGNAIYTNSQALAIGLINGEASSLSSFLVQEGLASSSTAPNVITENPNFYDNFLSFLSDSFVDGILITIGVLAILLDLYHGSVILSVIGLIMIGLGLIGAEIIGAPLIGLVFILVGAILILAEFKLGHGFMMITGMVVSLIGAFLLAPAYITYSPSANSSSPFSTGNLYFAAALIIIAFLVAYYLQYIIRSLGRRKYTGLESMVGTEVEVKTPLAPEGWVSFEGQMWKARLIEEGTAEAGEKVIVKSNEGLTLLVQKNRADKR